MKYLMRCLMMGSVFFFLLDLTSAQAQAPIETVTFESVNEPGWFVRHSFSLGKLSHYRDRPGASVLARSPLEKKDATFIVHRPGLSGTPGSVSLESVNFKDHFLRHQNYRIKLHLNDGTELFKNDASFFWEKLGEGHPLLEPGAQSQDANAVSLRSVNFPTHFIRHQDFELWLAPPTAGSTATFARDASFLPWPGLSPRGVETASYQSVNRTDRFIRHTFSLGVLHPVSTVLEKADATFIVRRPGLSGSPDSLSLESVNYPGHFLSHQNFRVKLQRGDGTVLFGRDASFFLRPALNGRSDAVSFESVNFPNHFIRHQDFELWLAPPTAGSTVTFRDDASFTERDGFVAEPLPCGVQPTRSSVVLPASVISTERLGQLTGSTDPAGLPILNYSGPGGELRDAGVEGVDMGASVVHQGRLFIYFGDVVETERILHPRLPGADLVGFTTDTDLRPGGFRLRPVKGGDGLFEPFSVDSGIGALPRARTPTGGFSYRVGNTDTMFVFSLWSDPSNPHKDWPTTVLASKLDPSQPGAYHKEFTFSYFRFLSVVPIVVKNAAHAGLPSQDGDGLILLAGGAVDAVHLAWMKLDPNRGPLLSTVRYYTGNPGNPWSAASGLDEATARADWKRATAHEDEAKTLVQLPPYFASVSAAYLADAKRWVLLYNTAGFELHNTQTQKPALPIIARFAENPWDWSDEVEVFNPCRDLAFSHFIHWTGLDDIDVRVGPPVNRDPEAWNIERGHAYGAFILTPFTRWDGSTQVLTLSYLMSTFNPYQVHVMRTRLQIRSTVPPPLSATVSVNQSAFAIGQTLTTTAGINNLGSAGLADIYVGTLGPDGTIEFITANGMTIGRLTDLSSFRPIATGISLMDSFSVLLPNFSSHLWTGAEPRGGYVFFLAILTAGALDDGIVTEDEILRLATAPFSFP